MTEQEIEKLTQGLTDAGLLIEAGWVGLMHAAMAKDASDIQVKEMRMAFFAGAQHLFASIMTIMEPGDDEPTDKDLDRMSQIADELERFRNNFEADLPTKGNA
jgi:hypothetical protein